MSASKKYTKQVVENLGKELVEYMQKDNSIWLKDFCIEKGFVSQRLSEFSKQSDVFKEALQLAKDIQESKLVRLGLSKTSNPAFVIFTLKNTSGWRDVQKAPPEHEKILERKLPEFNKLTNDGLIKLIKDGLKKVTKK